MASGEIRTPRPTTPQQRISSYRCRSLKPEQSSPLRALLANKSLELAAAGVFVSSELVAKRPE